MKKVMLLEILIISIFFMGCGASAPQVYKDATVYYTPEYKFVIESVETNVPIEESNLSGENLRYEDSNLEISFSNKHKYFMFELKNKSTNSFKILWDEAVFINYDNISQGVIHSNIKYNEAAETQLPTNVIKNGKINDTLIPKKNLIFFDKWYIRDMLIEPGRNHGTFNNIKEESIKQGNKYIGSIIQVMLPIQLKDKTIEYLFKFKVVGFDNVVYNKYTY